jgi:hypothetical protein
MSDRSRRIGVVSREQVLLRVQSHFAQVDHAASEVA